MHDFVLGRITNIIENHLKIKIYISNELTCSFGVIFSSRNIISDSLFVGSGRVMVELTSDLKNNILGYPSLIWNSANIIDDIESHNNGVISDQYSLKNIARTL